MPRVRMRQGLDQATVRWSAGEGMVRVSCAACGQPIAPIDEPLMLRVEGATPNERQAFHARCWVWWTEARRLEGAGARIPAAEQETPGAVERGAGGALPVS